MKITMISLVVMAASFSSYASTKSLAAENIYSFSGCNGGSGQWPAADLILPASSCQVADGENEVRLTGHCNGYVKFSIVCKATVVQSVELKDCSCD